MPAKTPSFKAVEPNSKVAVGTILQNWDEFCRRADAKGFGKTDKWKHNGVVYDPRVILKNYYRKTTRQGVSVHYFPSKYTNAGRVFAGDACGLQSFSRPLRHTICYKLYKDVDIENCHPVILLQYCKKHGYECGHIETYINKRAEYLKDLMLSNGREINKENREWAKKVMLSAVNGSMREVPKCIEKMKQKPDWFDAFYKQCNLIKKMVFENTENAKDLKLVKRKLKETGILNNVEGSLLNHILCVIENEILMTAIEFCKQKGGNVRCYVLCFDGFMIPITEELDFEKLQKYVEELTGYAVKFGYKAMDEVVDISDLPYTDLDEDGVIIVEDDSQGALALIERIKDDIMVSPSTIYMRDGNVWTNDKARVEVLLKVKCMRLNMCRLNAEGKEMPYSTNKSGCDKLVATAMLYLQEKPDETVEETIFRSTLGKICFKNGVYDFRTKSFTEWANVRDVYTTILIPYEYKERDEAKVNEVYAKIFKSIFDEHEDVGKDLLGALANALAGEVDLKYSVIGLGHRSSGKGVITDLCQYALGAYCSAFETGVMLMDGMEEVRRNAFLLERKYARIIIGNEAKRDDTRKDCVFDGNLMKKIQGGDEIEARRIYENSQRFRIQGKVFMMMNDMPSFQPVECLQMCENINFPWRFVPPSSMTEAEKLPFYRLADNTIKSYVKQPEVGLAFFHLLTDYYNPNRECSKESKSNNLDMLEACGDEEMLFKLNFKIVPDKDKGVSTADVDAWAKRVKLNVSAYKIKKILCDMGADYDRQKRLNGRKCSAYWGVIAKFQTDDDSDLDG